VWVDVRSFVLVAMLMHLVEARSGSWPLNLRRHVLSDAHGVDGMLGVLDRCNYQVCLSSESS
jgi:hypothetical protein